MAQHNKTCPKCGEPGHSKFYCKNTPSKPIPKVSAKKKIATSVSVSPKKPRKKRTDRAKAKEKAWDAFSAFIRRRDCIRFSGDPDSGICVTCRAMKPYKELQAGHFIGGRGNSVLFDERIVYSQCGHCNQKPPMGLGGNYVSYTLFMLEEWGREKVDEFIKLRHETKIYKLHDFIRIEQEYKERTERLLHG